MAKFVSGTEIFRKHTYPKASYFVKGTAFAGGNKFPLKRGVLPKDLAALVNKQLWDFFYADHGKE